MTLKASCQALPRFPSDPFGHSPTSPIMLCESMLRLPWQPNSENSPPLCQCGRRKSVTSTKGGILVEASDFAWEGRQPGRRGGCGSWGNCGLSLWVRQAQGHRDGKGVAEGITIRRSKGEDNNLAVLGLWVTKEGMMASDGFLPHFVVKEENVCEQCINHGNPCDSPSRLCEDIQSHSTNKINNCSKCSSRSGSFQLDYSNDFHANVPSKANSGSSSSCSEQNNCGSSHNYYYEDFHTDSSETSSRSSCSSHLEQTETKEDELPKKKMGHDHQAKGRKTLPKKKQQKKCYSDSAINSQKNTVARRLLSARLHNVKELKNEVSVLNNKLEASNMENQILKRLQCRHLKAISQYENAETNLPDLMAKQTGEVKTLKTLLRKSQEQEHNASRKLKEVETQLLKTKDTLQALQKLSEDKHLAERGELRRRLAALTERMEASDKKIQGLEKQLALNNASFNHQLAVEKKKTFEAQLVTTSLKMEIKLLNQKIKEKERELGIRNIYANRMLKDQQKKSDSESALKEVNVNKAVQVDIYLERVTFQKHERKQNAIISKEELTTKDTSAKDKLSNVYKEMELKAEILQTETLPVQEVSNRTCSELLAENLSLSRERQKNRREKQGLDLLKEEFEKLWTEESVQSTHEIQQKENGLGEAPIVNQEHENKREPKEAVSYKLTTVIPRPRTPSKLKKHYIFTEAVENLHQGFPSTGRLSTTSSACNNKQVNRLPSDIAEFKASDSSTTVYEPSFGKMSKPKRDISVLGEEQISVVSVEKKNTLMEELFGPNSILKDSNSPNFKKVDKEKKTLQNEKICNDISYMHDGLQCGDSKQTPIKIFDTFLENFN
ncbi:lebercilin-like protein isoform X2 [Anolis carolinensis]|uniref:lebercilin-like protein isoform X2 n=1 Tax=Anolis carolinensis TaxID=28377 RepID=UPI002F2B2117